MKTNTKIIAYYLPQYHQISENDKWWGKGYTEWKNAKSARPLFKGHAQPKEPLNDYYYDLLDDETLIWQAELAKKYKIYGFAFYHYWFGNDYKMLEKPAEKLLANKDIDMKFCFSWANENWTRTWEGPGGEKELLIGQQYGKEDEWEKHFYYLLPFFKDQRYIKKDNKPLILIYRLDKIPCYRDMFRCWRRLARENGLEGLHIVQMYFREEHKRKGVDAYTFYVPAGVRVKTGEEKFANIKEKIRGLEILNRMPLLFSKSIYDTFDYDKCYKKILEKKYSSNEYMGAFPDFDNTARRGKNAAIFIGATPKKFYQYLVEIIKRSIQENKEYMFITAWNEWGEGNYLEPDKKNGYGWLKAIRKAQKDARKENNK